MAAAFKAWKSGAWRTATKIQVWWLAAWREIVRVRVWHIVDGVGAWRTVYEKGGTPPPTVTPPPVVVPPTPPPVTLTVQLSEQIVQAARQTPGTLTTAQVSAAVSGGTPPYQYWWGLEQWDEPTPNVNTPDQPATSVSGTVSFAAPSITAQIGLTVQDSLGNLGYGGFYAHFALVSKID